MQFSFGTLNVVQHQATEKTVLRRVLRTVRNNNVKLWRGSVLVVIRGTEGYVVIKVSKNKYLMKKRSSRSYMWGFWKPATNILVETTVTHLCPRAKMRSLKNRYL